MTKRILRNKKSINRYVKSKRKKENRTYTQFRLPESCKSCMCLHYVFLNK